MCRREPVAVLDAAGQEPADVGAERAQRADHDRGRADAVDVVVAVHGDPGSGGDVALDRLKRALDPVERGRVVRDAGRQELAGRVRSREAAADEDLREHVADPELALERQRGGEVVGGDRSSAERDRRRRRLASSAAWPRDGEPSGSAGGAAADAAQCARASAMARSVARRAPTDRPRRTVAVGTASSTRRERRWRRFGPRDAAALEPTRCAPGTRPQAASVRAPDPLAR